MQNYPSQQLVYARPTNTAAVVSLVFGILAYFFLPVVGAVVAVICGHRARTRIRQTGEGGSGIAMAGLVLGWIQVAPIALICAWLAYSAFMAVLTYPFHHL